MTSYNPYQAPREVSTVPPQLGRLAAAPLGDVGTTVARSFALYADNLKLIVGICLAVYGPLELLIAGIETFGVAVDGASRLNMVASFVLSPLVVAAILYGVVEGARRGEPVGVVDALRYGSLRWLEAFRVNFVSGLLTVLGLFLLIVPGVIVSLWYAVAMEVVAVERPRLEGALARSKALTDGYRGHILLAAIILGVAFAVVLGVCMGLFTVAQSALGGPAAFAAGEELVPPAAKALYFLVAAAIGFLSDAAYPIFVMMGLVLYIGLAHGHEGGTAWLERVRWAPGAEGAATPTGGTDSARPGSGAGAGAFTGTEHG